MIESSPDTRWGVIITNLGTPQAPTKSAYRTFLKEFLSDSRVVEIPKIVWWPILNLFILPSRPRVLAKSYKKIWIEGKGSPLAVITQEQTKELQKALDIRFSGSSPLVRYAMTYGSPKLSQQIEELRAEGVDRILILPLNPQYSASTTGPIYDQYAKIVRNSRNIPDAIIHKHYYQRPDYISALSKSVVEFQREHGTAERLLMSFHGIPKRNVSLGDPYAEHCEITAALLASELKLEDGYWKQSFQSRFGAAEWLQPYTVDILESWAKEGVKSVQVLCPGFSADCLETLEEIAEEARDIFVEAGGENLRLIPCLNSSADHIQMMANIVSEYLPKK